MNKLTIDDLYSLETYARLRPEFRERVIEHKAYRRLALGAHLSLAFEDRLTMHYQVQEMLRAERIFEPYLSTKPEGLGMGLMICRTIVESHGGSLTLVSHRPAPASLRFVLPIVRKAR